MKVNISKLLKIKNRITSQIARVSSEIQGNNTAVFYGELPTEIVHEVDVISLLEKLASLRKRLISIKTAISAANQPVSSLIFRHSELKSQLSFLRGIGTDNGVTHSSYGDTKHYKVSQITKAMKDETTETTIKEIDRIQDELDSFNGSTFVEIEDSIIESE